MRKKKAEELGIDWDGVMDELKKMMDSFQKTFKPEEKDDDESPTIQAMNLANKQQLKEWVEKFGAKKLYKKYQVAFDYNYAISKELHEFMHELFVEKCPYHPIAVHPYDCRDIQMLDSEHERYWLEHDAEYKWWKTHNRSVKQDFYGEPKQDKEDEMPLSEVMPKTYNEFVSKVNELIKDYWKTEEHEEDPEDKAKHRTRLHYLSGASPFELRDRINAFSESHNCYEFHFNQKLDAVFIEYNYAGIDNWKTLSILEADKK